MTNDTMQLLHTSLYDNQGIHTGGTVGGEQNKVRSSKESNLLVWAQNIGAYPPLFSTISRISLMMTDELSQTHANLN